MREGLLRHMLVNELINSGQHGFVPKKSCVTNLLETFDVISEELARGKPIDLVYLDFAKAFDTVLHR